MPKRVFMSLTTMRAVAVISGPLSWAMASRSESMDRDRHHGQFRRPQQHHRQRDLSVAGGKLGEKFGVTGVGETGAIEHALGDRIGDDGAGTAGFHVRDRLTDRGEGCGRAGSVRTSGRRGDRLPDRHHW